MEYWALATGGTALVGLIMAFIYAGMVVRQDPGDEKMQSIAAAIREGAMAFIRREYRVLVGFVVIVFALIAVFIWYKPPDGSESTYTGIYTAIAYLLGAICSMTAGFVGMNIATKANVRTTHGAESGTRGALITAFRGGAVMGLTVAGLGLLGLSVVYLVFVKWWQVVSTPAGQASIIAGFSLGASSVALFARVGGGIYTKAADVGADLVGKVEAGIPEDDPRNPAVIADNVGDNVGDVAGMGADLYESYVGSIVAPIALAATVFAFSGVAEDVTRGMLLPMMIAAVGILASVVGTFFVRAKEGAHLSRALNSGSYAAAIITTAGTAPLVILWLKDIAEVKNPIGFWISIVAGLAAGLAIGWISEFYTSEKYKPVREIAESSRTGPATTILSGFSAGMESTAGAIFFLVAAIAGAYIAGNWAMPDVANSGIYGIALAAIGMLSTTGMTVSVDAYGPIADNAGGIAEMSGRPPEVRKITDSLDSLGNTTAAIAKGFAIASAGVTALALFKAYTEAVGIQIIDLGRWQTMVGLFLGGMFPFLFSSMAIKAVGRAAFEMIEEVRRQFREIPGLKEGKEGAKADYAKCVDISTKAALKRMVPPATIAIVSPVIIGLWDTQALAGYLAGALVVGFLIAIFMANAGGAWDNAKKYIEAGNLGGKGTPVHAAAVVGDTVGDPFKDTAGPSMNIMIKVMTVIALVFAPLFIR
ncbi:MAG: sodium-translocating pyrophosphatase [Actinomycetota bacterium]|nr:sodium-translocating pyrophosphatase [Actinomycetota bacterium]MDD5668296.1 sodium-translocating pyrophosphatase [Actinomycetota bacterium]